MCVCVCIVRAEHCVNFLCSLALLQSFSATAGSSWCQAKGMFGHLRHGEEVWAQVLYHHISTLTQQSLEEFTCKSVILRVLHLVSTSFASFFYFLHA